MPTRDDEPVPRALVTTSVTPAPARCVAFAFPSPRTEPAPPAPSASFARPRYCSHTAFRMPRTQNHRCIRRVLCVRGLRGRAFQVDTNGGFGGDLGYPLNESVRGSTGAVQGDRARRMEPTGRAKHVRESRRLAETWHASRNESTPAAASNASQVESRCRWYRIARARVAWTSRRGDSVPTWNTPQTDSICSSTGAPRRRA
ncbi:hypothetical protein C8R43DRAFT_996317 [Mycena crocata]|nr:hypothetical protein C8R43DRAFT_996317 [Mycena crocata]